MTLFADTVFTLQTTLPLEGTIFQGLVGFIALFLGSIINLLNYFILAKYTRSDDVFFLWNRKTSFGIFPVVVAVNDPWPKSNTMTAGSYTSCPLYLYDMSAPESHHHPGSSPPPRSLQSGRRSVGTCSSPALFAWWKIPFFLFCSPPLRRSLNLAWWVCLGRQCCAELGKSMFLYLQLRRKCRPFLLPTTVPSAWLINSHVSTDVVWTSLRQQVDVCVCCCLWHQCECDFHPKWGFIGDRGGNLVKPCKCNQTVTSSVVCIYNRFITGSPEWQQFCKSNIGW